jgi:hypothetical protein
MWSEQIESVLAGAADTTQVDVQHNVGDVSIATQDDFLGGDASFALWEGFHGEWLILAPTTDNSTSELRTLEFYESNLPLHTTGLSPSKPNIEMAPSNESPLEGGDGVQQPKLTDDWEQTAL